MSYSIQRAVSDGSMVLLPVSIEYFDRSEISVLFDGVVDARQWAWVGSTDKSISFTPAVANGIEVSVKRLTDIANPRHQFSQGAQFTTESLDEDIRQILHIAQEAKEGSGLGEVYQDLNFHGFKATNMGDGSLPGDAVNHAQMEVHDATIVGYKNAAAASAVEAAASAASINPAQFPTPATPDTFPMSNPAGTGWLYKTIAQLKVLLGLGTAAYTDSTAYQAADADIPTVAASQVEMAAGTEPGLRSMSPLRVAQAIAALVPGGFGSGQSWQDVTGSRAAATDYTNSTGKPIMLSIAYLLSTSTSMTILIGGVEMAYAQGENVSGIKRTLQIVVPNGAVYRINTVGSPAMQYWKELR